MIQRNAQTAQATMWREVVRNVRGGEGRRGRGVIGNVEQMSRLMIMDGMMEQVGEGWLVESDCYGLFGGPVL